MGTEPVVQNEGPPNVTPLPDGRRPVPLVDVPRTGALVWLLFLAFLLPPGLVVYFGRNFGQLPHQTLWVVLLGLPGMLLLLSLPRRYTLDAERLTIHGLLYRVRIPRERIRAVRPVGPARALASLGSVFCSDPRHALQIERDRGLALIISPREPAPFLALGAQADSRGGPP